MNTNGQNQENPSYPGGDRQHPRSERDANLPTGTGDNSPSSTSETFPTSSDTGSEEIPANLQFAITQLIRQEITLNQQYPDVDTAAALREKAPEAYKVWLETIQHNNQTENHIRVASVDNPKRIASAAQITGLIAVLAVLALAAFALYLDKPWFATIIAALDIVGLAAVFAGNSNPIKPTHSDESP